MRILLNLNLSILLCLLSTISLAASCSITNINSVNFGNYDVFNTTPSTTTGRIRIQCSPGSATYTIALDGGLYGTVSARKMSAGNDTPISYNLYTDAGTSIIWGNGTGGGVVVNGSGSTTTYTVYGKLDPLQDARVGSYQDTVLVTVTF